eukprot:364430-Chlamydomonas_euryale.AAC.6
MRSNYNDLPRGLPNAVLLAAERHCATVGGAWLVATRHQYKATVISLVTQAARLAASVMRVGVHTMWPTLQAGQPGSWGGALASTWRCHQEGCPRRHLGAECLRVHDARPKRHRTIGLTTFGCQPLGSKMLEY